MLGRTARDPITAVVGAPEVGPPAAASSDEDLLFTKKREARFLLKLDICLLTWAWTAYLIKQIDSSNYKTAYASGMQSDMNMQGNQLNYLDTFFRIGYAIFLIPSQLILTSVRPRFWLPPLELLWGIVTGLMAVAQSVEGMYALRFFIGVFEASSYPGIISILCNWYTPSELATRVAIFGTSYPAASMFVSFMQVAIQSTLNGVHGVPGWRWLFIFNGIMTVIVAAFGFLMIPDSPGTSRVFWLNEEDDSVSRWRIERVKKLPPTNMELVPELKHLVHSFPRESPPDRAALQLTDKKAVTNADGSLRYSVQEINAIPIAGYALMLIAMVFFAWLSGRTGWRATWIVVQMTITIIGCIILAVWPPSFAAKMVGYFLVYTSNGAGPILVAWMADHCPSPEERNIIIGVCVTLVYAVDSFANIFIYPASQAPNYAVGYKAAAAFGVASLCFVGVFKWLEQRSGRKSEAQEQLPPLPALKKIIKDVVNELSSMGLSPDVLHKLLVTEESTPSPRTASLTALPDQPTVPNGESPAGKVEEDDGDVMEFEFESDEASPPTLLNGSTPMSTASMSPLRPAPRSVFAKDQAGQLVDPILEHEASFSNPHSRARTFPLDTSARPQTTALAGSYGLSQSPDAGPSSMPRHKRFRVRLLSESTPNSPNGSRSHSPAVGGQPYPEAGSPKPMSVSGLMRNMGDVDADDLALAGSLEGDGAPSSFGDHARGRKVVRRSMVNGQRAKAEYILGDDTSHPTPQLVVHLPAATTARKPPTPARTSSMASSRSTDISSEAEDEGDDDDGMRFPSLSSASKIIRSAANSPETIRAPPSPRAIPEIDLVPPSPSLQRVQTALSPIFALASGADIGTGMRDLSLGESAGRSPDPVAQSSVETSTSESAPVSADRDRDIVIPLASDQAFFNLLTAALTSLSSFHASQQVQFRESVDRLCSMISHSIQPSSSSSSSLVYPAPFTSTPLDSAATRRAPQSAMITPYTPKPNKKDLYVWREIFTLWIEAEIFESSAERSRGERTVEQAEARLQKFAAEVVKRGLGDRRTLKGKKTREAWEEFLRLNVLLLDLKRFQMANISAARKILKKHDKRTALTASTGFQSFVRSTLSAVGTDGNITTWTFYNTSLPHVLLASLTDTLLPILPSLDDYACLICTSIAFKPIRLQCKHLFCVRCLVKMQKAGKAECPLCRSKVVLLADKNSLDRQVMQFMLEWFPKEVRDKGRENDKEIAEELEAEMGHQGPSCVVM